MSMPDLSAAPSRIVTITAVEFTEDAPKSGHVSFTLPCDLRHAASGTVVASGTRTVHLVDGHAELRIVTDAPGLTSDHISRRHGDKWAIWVKKSWESHPYPIRVPAGTTPISLAAIPAFDWRNQ